jgi:hypothetical protein
VDLVGKGHGSRGAREQAPSEQNDGEPPHPL